MENYKKHSLGAIESSKSLLDDDMFKTFMLNLNNASHGWRVEHIV
jgi:hypothetical protein